MITLQVLQTIAALCMATGGATYYKNLDNVRSCQVQLAKCYKDKKKASWVGGESEEHRQGEALLACLEELK